MIRRSVADPSEVAYFLVHAPAATATNTMVAVAGTRWRIEECNEQGKDLIGLDQHHRTDGSQNRGCGDVQRWRATRRHSNALTDHTATRLRPSRPSGERPGAGAE